MFRSVRYLSLLTLLATVASCATPNENMAFNDDAWRAAIYSDQYAKIRDFLHLTKKKVGFVEGITVITAPAFHSLVGIELTHHIRPGLSEILPPDGAQYQLNISIFRAAQDRKELGDVTKVTIPIEKYSLVLNEDDYRKIELEVRNSGILALSENALPEFGCTDGITIFVDIITENTTRFEARHVCDDGFASIQAAAEVTFSFVAQKNPRIENRFGRYQAVLLALTRYAHRLAPARMCSSRVTFTSLPSTSEKTFSSPAQSPVQAFAAEQIGQWFSINSQSRPSFFASAI